jgi:hypothetical protein
MCGLRHECICVGSHQAAARPDLRPEMYSLGARHPGLSLPIHGCLFCAPTALHRECTDVHLSDFRVAAVRAISLLM